MLPRLRRLNGPRHNANDSAVGCESPQSPDRPAAPRRNHAPSQFQVAPGLMSLLCVPRVRGNLRRPQHTPLHLFFRSPIPPRLAPFRSITPRSLPKTPAHSQFVLAAPTAYKTTSHVCHASQRQLATQHALSSAPALGVLHA